MRLVPVDLGRLVGEIFSLASIELYSVAGVLRGGRPLVAALREGSTNIYYLEGGELVRLNEKPVSMVAEARPGSGRVVFARDVARGRELHAVYTVSVEAPRREEPLSRDLKPMRVLSIVDAGERVVVTGVTERGIEVFEAVEGRARSVARLPGLGAVVDAAGGRAFGLLFDPTGRIHMLVVDLDGGGVRVARAPGSVLSIRAVSEDAVLAGVEGTRTSRLMKYIVPDDAFEEYRPASRGLEAYGPTRITFIGLTGDGRPIIVAGRGSRSRVFLDGEPLEGPRGTYGPAYELGPGIVASYSSLTQPPSIVKLEGGGYEVILSGEVPDWLRSALAGVREVEVESADGSRVPTVVLESGRAGKPGPTLVLVHGGPFAAYLDSWSVLAAAAALAGFHVVMPNYRGSAGFGEEWRSKIIGDPCGMDLEDVAAAAEWAERSGLATVNVVMGYSYGGYLTLCALTRKPGRFAAGVAGASVADWEEMYELSDPAFKAFIELLAGKDRGKWRERSPITHLQNLKDPLCIIHPQNDSRTPLKPILKLMEKASELGKSFEAHIAPDIGHAINTVDDIVKLLLPAILFLARLKANEKQGQP